MREGTSAIIFSQYISSPWDLTPRPHIHLAFSFLISQAELDDKMPISLRLEDECRGLSDLLLRNGYSSGGSVDPLEMPGQYLAGNEVRITRDVWLDFMSGAASPFVYEKMNFEFHSRRPIIHLRLIAVPNQGTFR